MANEQQRRNQMLAALLDPQYWSAFKERANQPIGSGMPTWGSFVPGLGPYLATGNAMDAHQRGDAASALSAGMEAGLWLIPGAAGAATARALAGRGARNVPLPLAPGLTGAGSSPAAGADNLARQQMLQDLQYHNPALTEEYWRRKGQGQ